MAHSDLVDTLISTYRTLNMTVRPLAENARNPGPGGKSLRDVISELRDSELVASQHLKNMTLGDAAGSHVSEEVAPPPINEGDVRVLLSDFGTAREAILALVREMPEDQWEMERNVPEGTSSIHAFIQELIERDRKALDEVRSLIPAASAASAN